MCSAKIVLSGSHILSVLGGNFISRSLDSTTRGLEFFDGLVEEIPDSVIIFTASEIIQSESKDTANILNKTLILCRIRSECLINSSKMTFCEVILYLL